MVRNKQRKGDLRFGTGNVISLYKAGLLTAPARELARNKIIQWVGRRLGGARGQDKSKGFYFSLGKSNENHQLGTGFFVHNKIKSAV